MRRTALSRERYIEVREPVSSIATAMIIATGLLVMQSAQAQSYPSKPIRWIIPYAAGGSTDIAGRMLGAQLSKQVGQAVVIENVPGASGVIGSDVVRRAAPDGYTLAHGSSASHSVNMVAMKENPYNPVTDFAPIILLLKAPNVVFVNPAMPIRNVKELMTYLSNNAETPYATAGAGSSSFLSGELLKARGKVTMTAVHYKGIGPAMQDVIAGTVKVGFGDVAAVSPHMRSGQLRVLGVTNTRRSSSMPDVPTLAESGLPGYESVTWQAIFAPAGTPAPIVQRLNAEIGKALQSPEVKTRLESTGSELEGGTPEQLREFVRADIQKWVDLVRDAKIKFD
jgi:tripartite-type tricarboxylate transporter receptor subunit TctC